MDKRQLHHANTIDNVRSDDASIVPALRPSSRPSVCGMPSALASGPAAAEVPNRHRLGSNVVHHSVAADRSRRRSGDPYGNDPAGPGSLASRATASSISRTPVGVVAEEPGRLVNRLGLPDDLTAHPARPSRRSASSCGTYEVCLAASRARQSASAARSSASSSSCALAACSRARKRRKSDTGTTTAAWPPRWITSYGPVSGPFAGISSAGWAVIVLLPVRDFRLCHPSWHACRPARCHGAATARVLPDSAELPSAPRRA